MLHYTWISILFYYNILHILYKNTKLIHCIQKNKINNIPYKNNIHILFNATLYIDQYIILFFIVMVLIIFTYMQCVVAIFLPETIVDIKIQQYLSNHTYLHNQKIFLMIFLKNRYIKIQR